MANKKYLVQAQISSLGSVNSPKLQILDVPSTKMTVQISEGRSEVRVKTINDLTPKDQAVQIRFYFRKYNKELSHVFGYLSRFYYKYTFLAFESGIEMIDNESLIYTDHRFSISPLSVPIGLAVSSSLLFVRPWTKEGVFRVTHGVSPLQHALWFIHCIVDEKTSLNKILRIGHPEGIDEIDLADAYKSTLKRLSSSILPQKFVERLITMFQIPDLDLRKICAKGIIYTLPPLNRRIFEHNVYIAHKILYQTRSHEKRLDLYGIAVVMAPNLIAKNNPREYANIEKLNLFIRSLEYIYREAETLFCI